MLRIYHYIIKFYILDGQITLQRAGNHVDAQQTNIQGSKTTLSIRLCY